MGKLTLKVTLSLFTAVLQLLALGPICEAGTVQCFSGGATGADGSLSANGTVRFANLSVPQNSIGLNGTLSISPLAAGESYAISPSVDIGEAGAEWAFSGIGYGPFGRQGLFSDGKGSAEMNFSSPGNASATFLLPMNSTVQAASLEVRGIADQKWWNPAWRCRIHLNVTDISGRNQTDFAVETLLDTRNWTLGSAQTEFRVTSVAPEGNETEVPIQVVDEICNGSKCFEASLVFAVQNLTAGQTNQYHLYYNNPTVIGKSSLYRDFKPRIIRNRLLGVSREDSFFGPFQNLRGSAFDANGNYWVVDYDQHCVLGYTGTLGVPGLAGTDGSHLNHPDDVAVAPSGRIAVTDTGNYRVQVFEPDGTLAFTLGVTGVAGADNSHFLSPYGVAADSDGWLYVTDVGANRIQVFDSGGAYKATIGGTMGPGNDQFFSPTGIFVTSSKDVLVADTDNCRVQSFRHLSGFSWQYNFTIGTTGQPGITNDKFVAPLEVAVDSNGKIYVVDELAYRVQVFSGTSYLATMGVSGIGLQDNSHFNLPVSIAFSPSGAIYVVDLTGVSCRVQVFDASRNYIQSLGDRNWANQVSAGTSNSQLNGPWGVAVNSSGFIFISDTSNHRVQVFDPFGTYVRTLGVTGVSGADVGHFLYPRGLDVASGGKLLVADAGNYIGLVANSNHRVLVFNDLSDGFADLQLGLSGSYGNDMNHLNMPFDVAVNSGQRTAVADKGFLTTGNPQFLMGQRVQVYANLQNTYATETYGIAGVSGSDASHLNWPYGVGISETGAIYVADTVNNRVLVFNNDGNNVPDLALNPSCVQGQGPGQFKLPSDVAPDSGGRILVADTGNNRIQVLNSAGQHQFNIGESAIANSDGFHFRQPTGIDVGGDDKIYVADSGNNRVVRITQANIEFGSAEGLIAPENVALDLGADGTREWNLSGILDTGVTVSGLAPAINALLSGLNAAPDVFGNRMVAIPLNISNSGHGSIRLLNLSVTYSISLEPRNLVTAVWSYVSSHPSEADAAGNVLVPITFTAESAGGVRLHDLNLTCDLAPVLLSNIPELSLDEDTCAPALCDLADHFRDDLDTSLNYSVAVLTNSTLAEVRLNGSRLVVDSTVRSAANWSGVLRMRVNASDSRNLRTASNEFNVTVRPVNDRPVITSVPGLNATVGSLWTYSVKASDVENDTLTYSLQKAPTGMAASPTGLVSWTPSATQEYLHDIVLRVSDGSLWAEQNFTLNVTKTSVSNRPPRVTSTPVTVAEIGKSYVYRVEAIDDDNDTLSFSLPKSPAGMSIGPSNGTLSWTPNASQSGAHQVIVAISDSKVTVQHEFNVTVATNASDVLPVITIIEPAAGKKLSGKVWVRGTASARVGSIEVVEVSVDGISWYAAVGKASWAFQLDSGKFSNGVHSIRARVRDSSGNYGQAELSVTIQNGSTPPGSPGILGSPTFLMLILVLIIAMAAGVGVYAVMKRRKASGGTANKSAAQTSSSSAKDTGSSSAQSGTGATAVSQGATVTGTPPKPKMAAKGQAPPLKPVDSAFLVYHDGRLITYFSRSESIKLDATLDMIRKFVKASFSGQLGRLDSIQYENMNVIMERGIQMYMVVITPLDEFEDLRRDMRRLLNEVHEKHKSTFKIWDGEFSSIKDVKLKVEKFAGEDVWEDVEDEAAPKKPAERMPHKSSLPPEPDDGPDDDIDDDLDDVPPPKAPGKTAEFSNEPPKALPKTAEFSNEPPKAPGKTNEFKADRASSSSSEPALPLDTKSSRPEAVPPTVSEKENAEKVRVLEEKFLKGDISEALYRELKEKYSKK